MYVPNNRKEENFQINNLEKGEQTKLQVRAREEIIKIRIEINETETKSQSTENLKKIGSHLVRPITKTWTWNELPTLEMQRGYHYRPYRHLTDTMEISYTPLRQ